MDAYQIPTIDGRHITVSYDEQSRETLIHFPPPAEGTDGDDETQSSFGFTTENAERIVDALAAIQARANGRTVD
jgi:hypothetical protein